MVMYRDFAQRKARALGLSGEVQNMPDGSVRVIVEGEKKDITEFMELLKKGPVLARVDDVLVEWVEPTGAFSGFSIRQNQ